VILKISPCWKGKADWFVQLYKELNDKNVAHAWFHWLLKRDIGEFNPRHMDPPYDFKSDAKKQCMPISHRFILEHFASSSFPTEGTISSCYKFLKNDNVVTIRTAIKHLFQVYKQFADSFYGGKTVYMNSFVRQISEIGVTKIAKRIRINGQNPAICVEFSYQSVSVAHEELYGTAPDETWRIASHPQEFSKYF
jgi:hypothetical protein